MSASALLPVERPAAVVRGALGAFSAAGPAALQHAGNVVDATRALPHAVRDSAVGAIVVVVCGLLPSRARLLSLPLLVLMSLHSPTAAVGAAAGVVVSALLDRGAASFSTTSRVLQWTTTVLLGLSLLSATLTLLLAASGSWAPLPWSGAAALSSSSSLLEAVGAVCIAGGMGFVVWCARFLTAGGGTPDPIAPPQAHCTSGPYATTSHPMQRGQLLVLLGLTLLVGTQGALAVAAVLAALLVGPVRLIEANAWDRRRDARQGDDAAPNL
jgi:protein-S-isoprenylcysteine O-methyltransferase Ste14